MYLYKVEKETKNKVKEVIEASYQRRDDLEGFNEWAPDGGALLLTDDPQKAKRPFMRRAAFQDEPEFRTEIFVDSSLGSECRHAILKLLGLKVKKANVHYRQLENEWITSPIIMIELIEEHSEYCILRVYTESGYFTRISSEFLANMQDTNFVEEMNEGTAEE